MPHDTIVRQRRDNLSLHIASHFMQLIQKRLVPKTEVNNMRHEEQKILAIKWIYHDTIFVVSFR